jgi:sec-independent protein translocase protein TatC
MPLFDHIGELRRRLTIIVAALLFASVVLYFFAPSLAFFLLEPISEYLSPNGEPITSSAQLRDVVIATSALTGFALKFKIALVAAIVVCCPIWIWQLLGFFMPALKPNERKWVLPTFFAAIALFIAGAAFCYFLILDAAFSWLIGQTVEIANVLANVEEYINTILLFEIGFGVAFELPLVVFYLTVFNIVPYKKLRSSWRVVYIVLMVVCAMVTPDANPITMIMMFAAMAILYEGSLLLSRIVLARRLARQRRQEASEADYDNGDEDGTDDESDSAPSDDDTEPAAGDKDDD